MLLKDLAEQPHELLTDVIDTELFKPQEAESECNIYWGLVFLVYQPQQVKVMSNSKHLALD